MSSYYFTKTWFDCADIKSRLMSFFNSNQLLNILEIGSYEGASSVFIADNLLSNTSSKLTCVDPFLLSDNITPLTTSTENTFLFNISKSKHHDRIFHKKMLSSEFYLENKEKYDLIYIDGSHEVEDVRNDFLNCIKILNKNGIMWMDDYAAEKLGLTQCINELYEQNKNMLEVIHVGYQVAFRYTG